MKMSDALMWFKHFREIEVNEGRIVISHLSKHWVANREKRKSITSEEWDTAGSSNGNTAIQALSNLLEHEKKELNKRRIL